MLKKEVGLIRRGQEWGWGLPFLVCRCVQALPGLELEGVGQD